MARNFSGVAGCRLQSAAIPTMGTNPRTIFAWYRQTVGAQRGIVTLGTSTNAGYSLATIGTSGQTMGSNDNIGQVSSPLGFTVPLASWGRAGCTLETGAAQSAQNNSAYGGPSNLGSAVATDKVIIGNYTLAPDLPFAGDIAWAAVWTAVLTIDEMTGLFAGQHPYNVRRGSLAFFAPLRLATGAAEQDLVGGLSLAVTGTVAAADSIPIRAP